MNIYPKVTPPINHHKLKYKLKLYYKRKQKGDVALTFRRDFFFKLNSCCYDALIFINI